MGDISELVNISWPDHYREFLTGIWTCFLEKYKTDLEVYCSGHRVNVHQVVLAIFCPIFKQQQQDGQDFNLCFNSPVGLEEADLGLLIEFLYRGKIKVSRDRLGVLREAGLAFGLQVLVDLIDREDKRLQNEQLVLNEQNAKSESKELSELCDSNSAVSPENEDSMKPESSVSPQTVDNKESITLIAEENSENSKKKVLRSNRHKRLKEKTADISDENYQADTNEYEEEEEEEEEESDENPNKKGRNLEKKREIKIRSVRKPKQFLKCPHCSYGTSRKQLYLNHLDTHDRSVKRYVCEICSKAFRNNSSFGRHVYFHKNPDKLLRCTHCNYNTMQRSVWLQHLAIRHQLDPEGNPLKKDIQCSECDFVCITDYQLKSHVMRKHSTKSFKCDECDYCAVMRADLEKHVKIRHRNDRPYMCETCGYRSKTRSHFNCHLQMHTGIKPFKCHICGQDYTRSNKLKEHLRSHVSNEKPYLCHLCSYACRRKYNLTLHIKRIHKDGSVGKGRCPPRTADEPAEAEPQDQQDHVEAEDNLDDSVEVSPLSSQAVIQLQNMEPIAVMGEVSLTTVCMTGLECLQPFNPLD